MNNGLSGGSSTPAFPKRGPDAGTTGKVRPQCGSWHRTTHNVDWPALSSSDPIRWRPRADPEQKHDPGERTLASGNMGLTNQGPLQKPALSAAKCGNAPRMSLRSSRATSTASDDLVDLPQRPDPGRAHRPRLRADGAGPVG